MCCLHACFVLVLAAILAIHVPAEPIFRARKTVSQALLPAQIFGEDAW